MFNRRNGRKVIFEDLKKHLWKNDLTDKNSAGSTSLVKQLLEDDDEDSGSKEEGTSDESDVEESTDQVQTPTPAKANRKRKTPAAATEQANSV